MFLLVFLLFVYFTKVTIQESLSFGNIESQFIFRAKQQTYNRCVLPNHPANGEIKIVGQETDPYLPGSSVVPNTIIDLSCIRGTVTETLGLSRAICYQDKWKPSILQMRCVRRCPPVQTEREDLFVTCIHKNSKVNCSNPIEGTIIQLACKPFYYSAVLSINTCRNGTWDGAPSSCQPECGNKRVFIPEESQYPWVAGIYESTPHGVYFKGGATLISRQTLLSVADIFTSKSNVRYDKDKYVVTAGKYFREFEDQRDRNMQFSQIKRLYIPKNYRASFNGNNLGNFAVITLTDPFIFTEYVQPVCVDWTNAYESSDLREDAKGVIAGWGYTQTGNHNGSEELQELNVSYKSKDTCLILDTHKAIFYTDDKFCGGYDYNSTDTCDIDVPSVSINYNLAGDAGSGVFFQSFNDKFYVRGILSTISEESPPCSSRSPGLYTRVSTYLTEVVRETGGTP